MWSTRGNSKPALISLLISTGSTHFNSWSSNTTQFFNSISSSKLMLSTPIPSVNPPLNPHFLGQSFSFCSSSVFQTPATTSPKVEPDIDDEGEEDDDIHSVQVDIKDGNWKRNVETIMGILQNFRSSGPDAKHKLDQCGIVASSDLVMEVLSRIRNDWEAAFTFFLWAGKQSPDYAHSVQEYHAMISILGKMRKYDTAWALIDEMRGGRNGHSLVTPNTLLIMIRRYSAVHDVGKAINTFYALKRFKFDIGIKEFQDLLCALCRYKNVQDAEHLLFCNEKVFPFDTKSFNVILNGWCNIVVNLREAKRFWKEMDRRGISHDAISYSCMISCYSKASNLSYVLKLFNRMKELEIAPDRKVYNAVIYALAKGNLVKEARNLMKTMAEKGFIPNAVTYNSLIKPLCKARRTVEAKLIFDEMLQQVHSPSIRTYHAFFGVLKTGEEVFELLEKMKTLGCNPTNDTYIMLIRKFCRWRQLENVFRLWKEMSENGVNPDRSSYIVLIHGLFLNVKLEEAFKYYEEMKDKGFLPEPKTSEMLQAWLSGKQTVAQPLPDLKGNLVVCGSSSKNTRGTSAIGHERDFRKQPETRRAVHERGFSFWD
ncbi:pentatricopeptide repeat-containing protein At5g15010, mitochondrial-like [Macadamia integrifolia]|uniref:pentatricopeptide repeat-containing protein At5g15010, mitochondrial-like n=1 Tax=Macadamia integrifolia TaxID=60698 RepID=UPI001C4EB936|nr:pentatricopeptide repeat-containing protein At5g15010, mitochondrial-like [Macadamia integrifolia]